MLNYIAATRHFARHQTKHWGWNPRRPRKWTAERFSDAAKAGHSRNSGIKRETTMTELQTTYAPLTPENSAVILIDHQVGLMTGVRDYSTGELKHNVVALAKA